MSTYIQTSRSKVYLEHISRMTNAIPYFSTNQLSPTNQHFHFHFHNQSCEFVCVGPL